MKSTSQSEAVKTFKERGNAGIVWKVVRLGYQRESGTSDTETSGTEVNFVVYFLKELDLRQDTV